jgi:diguanylate cyclase (GGDEF)-like protein
MVAVFMVDLDHFKDVNDQYDHSVGSSVLAQFGDLLRQQCQEGAIAIHRSGDEFFLLVPCNELSTPLALACRIQKTVRTNAYRGIEEIQLTAAQGICVCNDKGLSFKSAVTIAEKAYNPKGKNQTKLRDSVRLVCASNTAKPSCGEENRKAAFIIVKTHLNSSCLFKNPYLDFLSFVATNQKCESDIQENVDSTIKWINPETITGMQLLGSSEKISYYCGWSSDELAFALFHGFCRNTTIGGKRELSLTFCKSGCGFSITSGQKVLYSYGDGSVNEIGESYMLVTPERKIEEYATQTTVLVQIGEQKLPIPEDCFYHVIRIDARATIGGNLPDFWAAALSELIEMLWNHAFLTHVLVFGKKEHGKTFFDILQKCDKWGSGSYSFSFLSKKMQQPIERIQYVQERLKQAVQFFEPGDSDNIIPAMVSICQSDRWVQQSYGSRIDSQHRFLNRSLSYEKIRLGIKDGCIVDTLEEAFPTVLEIIRNCDVDNYLGSISDQAGRELRELPNFKIVIKKPSSRNVPNYYEEEKDELERYYQSVLGDEGGFFQKYLQANNQYDAVLNHIVHLISKEGLQYATRRAVLVVPHCVENSEDITPLGLVSVYIAPREQGEDIVLDFSFTWRTVEAVVGFPYSLYGSVRYAERILDEICQRCDPLQGINLKIGAVSYLAYSLHMFLDDTYTQIIRGIINDASV